jgi:hypothetical protein
MPLALRAQVALVGILAVLLIPIGTSSLRGLTHILTCKEQSNTPFSVEVPASGPPSILSSTVIERPDPNGVSKGTLCGGLTLEMILGTRQDDRVDATLNITNHTKFGWRGSVSLKLDGTTIPINIGSIAASDTKSDRVTLRLKPNQTYDLNGSLLIGP